MHARRLEARGFRNLETLKLDLPESGAVLLGPNGHGKTNFLEALCYPVLYRSIRGAGDQELVTFGAPGFKLELGYSSNGSAHDQTVRYESGSRRKQVSQDGEQLSRLSGSIGHWMAVAFLPDDVNLAAGPASRRRQFLDRMLSLADRQYLRDLSRYRSALAQRNAALRHGDQRSAAAYDGVLARSGAGVVSRRLAWVTEAGPQFLRDFSELGETGQVDLRYQGDEELADEAAWPDALLQARQAESVRRTTTVGPHRDDLLIEMAGRSLRGFGSTGQLRCAAVALKLAEFETLCRANGPAPALVLDDVYAELDGERQQRLTARLLEPARGQVWLSAPRTDELPRGMDLPVWHLEHGTVKA